MKNYHKWEILTEGLYYGSGIVFGNNRILLVVGEFCEMTMELLKRIIEENNIPKDVHFMIDSGWECDSTEMNGVYYNIQSNTIVFTQGYGSDREYEQSDELEILYCPELIKIQELRPFQVLCKLKNLI